MTDSTDNISIQIVDNVDGNVITKLIKIADAAEKSHTSVEKLKNTISSLSSSNALNALNTQIDKTSTTALNAALGQERLTQAQAKSATQSLNTATAQQRLELATKNVATAQERLTNTQKQGEIATTNKVTAVLRQITAEENLYAAISRGSIAETNAAAAKQRLQAATTRSSTAFNQELTSVERLNAAELNTLATKQRLITATNNKFISEANEATAIQRLTNTEIAGATATKRLETANNNLAASSSRAELAALRLENAQKRTAKASNDLLDSLSPLKNKLLALFGLNELKNYADEYTRATGLVNIFSKSQEETALVMDKLFNIAQRTRQGLEGTVKTYHQLTIAGAQLGASQNEMLSVTELVGKAFAIQGTPTNTAKAGILQLSHAMTEGIVRGRQFNSLMIEMPRVLQVVADHIDGAGGSVAKLRKMMLDGELTSKKFFDAAVAGSKDLDGQFDKTGKTIAQSFTYLRNSIVQYVGQANQASGASAALFSVMKFLGDNIDTVVKSILVLASPLLITVVTSLASAFIGLALAAAANPFLAIVTAATMAISALVLFSDKLKVSSTGLATWGDVGVETIKYIINGFNIFSKQTDSDLKDSSSSVASFGETITTFAEYALSALNKVGNAFSNIKQLVQLSAVGVANAVSNFNATPEEQKRNENLYNTTVTDILNQGEKEKNALLKAKDSIKAAAEIRATNRIIDDVNKKYNNVDLDKALGKPQDFAQEDDKAAKMAERRSDALAKINQKLADETKNLFMVKEARDAANKADAIFLQFNSQFKKLPLSDVEKSGILAHIQATQRSLAVQKEFDSIVGSSSKEALQKYKDSVSGANEALKQNLITQSEYQSALLKAKQALETFNEPFKAQQKALDDQNKLLGLFGDNLIYATEYQKLYNKALAENKDLNNASNAALNQTAINIANQTVIQKHAIDTNNAHLSIINKQIDAQRALNDQLQATKDFYTNTPDSENKTTAFANLNVSQANLNLQGGQSNGLDALVSGAGRITEGFKNSATSIAEIYGNLFTKLADGFSSTFAKFIVEGGNLKDMFRSLATSIEEELISALIKTGIQIVTNKVLTLAATQATTAAQVTSDAVKTGSALTSLATITPAVVSSNTAITASAAPAAGAMSIATFGAAAAAALVGIAAVMALTKGFSDGGYTGHGGVNDVAGIVHKGEIVWSQSDIKNAGGVANVEAMRNGAKSVNQNMPQQNVINNTTNNNSGGDGHTIINVVDPALVQNYLTSNSGKRVILNVIKEHEMSNA